MLEETGCDAVMIGRGALGNPWLFSRTVHLLKTGELLPIPDFEDRINMALRHLEMVREYKGEHRAVREMRKHVAWYLKGLRDSAKIREAVNKATTVQELIRTLEEYKILLEELDEA